MSDRTSADRGSVIPDIAWIRRRDGTEQRATFFELFFDLVYVFAVTQLSHHLLATKLSWLSAAPSCTCRVRPSGSRVSGPAQLLWSSRCRRVQAGQRRRAVCSSTPRRECIERQTPR
jgi:hypothetical protein